MALETLIHHFREHGDRGRSVAYTKALNTLKKYDKPIEDLEHILDLPYIGKSI